MYLWLTLRTERLVGSVLLAGGLVYGVGLLVWLRLG